MKFVNTSNHNILNQNLFKLIVYEKFLDLNFFEKLDANFPNTDEVKYICDKNDKNRYTYKLNKEDNFFKSSTNIWNDFFQIFESREFLELIYNQFRKNLIFNNSYKFLFGIRDKDKTYLNFLDFFKKKVKIEFAFSILKNNAVVPLHTESGKKCVTCLLYFGKTNTAVENGTNFFVPNNRFIKKKFKRWSTKRLEKDLEKEFFLNHKKIPVNFIPNNMVMFSKNAHTWHNTDYMIGSNVYRKSISIFANMKA